MNLKNKIFLINYLFLSLTIVQSQTINGFFPLSVSNKWYFYLPGNGDSIRTILNVSKDTLMSDGKSYAKIDRYEKMDTRWTLTEGYLYLRQMGNIVYQYPDSVFFDFDWTDSTSIEDLPVPFNTVKVDTLIVFSQYRKTYFLYIMDPYEYVSYTDSIGFNALYALTWRDWAGVTRYLKGCIINGVTYGEIVTNLELIKDNLPRQFELAQNYPNPFNPKTLIEFYLPTNEFVTLKIFNIKGQLIKTLVNSYKQPGKYKIFFERENIASGVYYYQLVAGEYTNTKMMVLLK
jgi:hypothetical protein